MAKPVKVTLPKPWPTGQEFEIPSLPPITWLVGPNGSGKSRFLRALRDSSSVEELHPRHLGSDRFSDTRRPQELEQVLGHSQYREGVLRAHYDYLLKANERNGSLLGTFVLLDRRSDLRIRVEATVSQLLKRVVRLEVIDGKLVPKIRFRSGAEYGALADECHGVLELILLLANIYDDQTELLLIDEPELNLHPQYQAFVLDEMRRTPTKKYVLATHSPSFVHVSDIPDLSGVICFHGNFDLPSRYISNGTADPEIAKLLPRMTEEHRTFFFAEEPVFSEGPFDAAMVSGIQRGLSLSSEAAGSCVLPSGGKDGAARFLMLSNALGKKAHFVFDLDALFDQRLAAGASQNQQFLEAVAKAGHQEFRKHLGQLERDLNSLREKLLKMDPLPSGLQAIAEFIRNKDVKETWGPLLVSIGVDHGAWHACGLKMETMSIKGILDSAAKVLAKINVHLLCQGALENYLPSYTGNPYHISEDAKSNAVAKELAWLGTKPDKDVIETRYQGLHTVISSLPAAPKVNIVPTLKREIADILHVIIRSVRQGEIKETTDVPHVLGEAWKRVEGVLSLTALTIRTKDNFSGELNVADRFRIGKKLCFFDQQTQTNNPDGLELKDEKDTTKQRP